MDWGNAIVCSKETDPNGVVTSIEMDLHLEGDFKKTEKKITWLAEPAASHPHVSVTLHDYDYLITKKKLEEEDDVNNFITPVTEFKMEAVTDSNVKRLKKGDIIQFERKGYYILDQIDSNAEDFKFILIPDGRAASLVSKAAPSAATSAPASASKANVTDDGPKIIVQTRMYETASVYGQGAVVPPVDTKMYNVQNVYSSS
jgi:glutamyl-tRNA synthetase